MTFSIKAARKEQVDLFPALAKHTILTCYPAIIGLEAVEGYARSGLIETFFQENWRSTLCCYLDDALIGMGAATEDRVDLMIIVPEHHRTGAGSVLLAALETVLFEAHETIWLDSFEKNIQAVNFYLKNGWAVDHRKTEDGIDYVVMKKQRG